MKAFDMPLRYRNNFNDAHRLGNVLIPPLAEWREKQLSWLRHSDNGLI